MSAPTRVDVDALLCPRCGRSKVARHCTCHPQNPGTLATEVRRRHELAVHRATWAQPLPAPPAHARWACGSWDGAHLIGCTGRSLCDEVGAELGSRPAHDGVRWCRMCADIAEGINA